VKEAQAAGGRGGLAELAALGAGLAARIRVLRSHA